MTHHVSEELRDAMLGLSPLLPPEKRESKAWHDRWVRQDRRSLCGEGSPLDVVEAALADHGKSLPEDLKTADCAKCLRLLRASLPEEALVRLDYLETRHPPPRCPSCDFGPFIPMSEADGFNHRAVSGSTHVCTACGKGWKP